MCDVPDPKVPERAIFQGGVFTRPQAYDAGHTRRQVRRWLEVGRWKVVAGAAVAPGHLGVGAEQLGFAAVLSWPGAVVSHHCAGALHGFPIDPGGFGTAIVEPQRGSAAAGLRAYRVRLSPDEIVWRAGMPLTDRRRTASDLLASLAWNEARDLYAWLATRRIVTSDHVEAWAQSWAGRPGAPQLRRLAVLAKAGSFSAGEDQLHEVLHEMRVTGWTANAPIVVGGRVVAVVDVLVPEYRLVMQVDGWRAHGGRAAFQRDRSQQNALVAAGYHVLRFTWDDLTQRRAHVMSVVRNALTRLA
jgi:very-short-patch-repair endonuclease